MKLASMVILTVVLLSSVFTSVSFAQGESSIGVSPGSIDLGDVEKGSTKLVDFFLITPSNETLLVSLEPETVSFNANSMSSSFSEENVLSWVSILNSPVELKPSTEVLETTGGTIKSHRQVSFLVNIPNDAEPGEHMFNIKPVPMTSSETTGAVGSIVVGVTSIRIRLNVSGNAVRKGTILDVESGNYGRDSVEVNTYFQNTGTVTISASGTQKVYDDEGNFIAELNLPKMYVKPKEIRVFKGILRADKIDSGDYAVYSSIDYKTGTAEKSSIISLSPPTGLIVEGGLGNTVMILLILAIIVISIAIYKWIK